MTNAADSRRAARSAPGKGRSLDHFVNCVGDIETAGNMYRNLGFRVMPVMEHVNIGTSNTVVQFQDTYLELIGDVAWSKSDQITTTMQHWTDVAAYIYWQTAFTSQHLETDQQLLRDKGLEPEEILNASRRVRKIGGGWDQTASRSMYCFDRPANTGSLFISDHPRPETIWMPGYTSHPNSAVRVVGMSYLADNPLASVDYYRKMIGDEPVEASVERLAFHTPRGEFFEIVAARDAATRLPGAEPLQAALSVRGAAYTIAVESLERCRLALRDGGVPAQVQDGVVTVPAAFAAGMAMRFIEE